MTTTNPPAETADLDAFLNEMLGEGQTFRLYGKTWRLRHEMPFEVGIALQRDDLTDEQSIKLFRSLLDPPTQFDELLNMGLGQLAMSTIVRIAFGVSNGMTVEQVLLAIREEQQTQHSTDADTDDEGAGDAGKE